MLATPGTEIQKETYRNYSKIKMDIFMGKVVQIYFNNLKISTMLNKYCSFIPNKVFNIIIAIINDRHSTILNINVKIQSLSRI